MLSSFLQQDLQMELQPKADNHRKPTRTYSEHHSTQEKSRRKQSTFPSDCWKALKCHNACTSSMKEADDTIRTQKTNGPE